MFHSHVLCDLTDSESAIAGSVSVKVENARPIRPRTKENSVFRNILKVVAACLVMFVATQAPAADKAAEAQTLVNEAIAHFEKVGADKAFKDFSDPASGFIRGDLYLVVQDFNGKMIWHATNPKFNGKDLSNLKDSDGVYINKETARVAKESGEGWIEYKWVNPTTKKIAKKRGFVKAVKDLIFVVGYYPE